MSILKLARKRFLVKLLSLSPGLKQLTSMKQATLSSHGFVQRCESLGNISFNKNQTFYIPLAVKIPSEHFFFLFFFFGQISGIPP